MHLGDDCIYTWLVNILHKEYEKLALIKENPRGRLYLIRHIATGQKFILRHFAGNIEVYKKLMNYSCTNLPKIFEAVSANGYSIVIEEFIEGDTLGFLLQDTLFSPAETRDIALQICRALWVLHSFDAVHRDIKPENIILRGSDAILIDFDAARICKPENNTDTQVLGTIGFAAPEQYGISQSDYRTDIYALGILINIMLTGQHPSTQLAKGYFGRIVNRCTHVSPKKRYRDILHLMKALY